MNSPERVKLINLSDDMKEVVRINGEENAKKFLYSFGGSFLFQKKWTWKNAISQLFGNTVKVVPINSWLTA